MWFTNRLLLRFHENGARRIYVGFNVKGRDAEYREGYSVHPDEKLKLPEGYYYNYGGEFQNLQSATQRLIIVVPVALIIILLLLYATVKNLRESSSCSPPFRLLR